VVMWATG